MSEKTHFGFQSVDKNIKADKVAEVFDSVASNYDIMNDVMSVGLHRYWKYFTLELAQAQEHHKILDIAGGTGDLTLGFSKRVPNAEIWLSDINANMLTIGRDRLLNKGKILPAVQFNAEYLPFSDNYFDIISLAFGLRNMTNKDKALSEIFRVLKPGGKALILEFSKVNAPFSKLYDFYSFKILPRLGKWIAKDEGSYRYLAESIRMHPDQEALKNIMLSSGFALVDYYNLSAGVVALHMGVK
jgi:demethylmenaquinone methyltransferase/2-methoxy-6-polyprenyl-1,4-benzoquinol methylase